MKSKNLLLTALSVVMGGTFVLGQTPANNPTSSDSKFPKLNEFNSWSVGLNFGSTLLHSDLDPKKPMDMRAGIGFGANLSKSFTHAFALQGNLFMGVLKGQNTSNKTDTKLKRVTSNTPITLEYTVNGVFTLGNISYLNRVLPKWNYYVSIGIGNIMFTPYTYKTKDSNWPKQTTELVIPVAVGAKYKVGKNIAVTAEYCYKSVMSDKLDNNVVVLSSNDKYSYINLGATYTFGKKDKNIEWVNPLEQLYSDLDTVKKKMNGLVGDKDHDGVADLYDKDNATPDSVKVYGDGTVMDSDGDGVPDFKDAELFSTKGAKVDTNGKELDSDGDGVADSKDLEPNTEKGKLVNFQGITIKVSDGGSVSGSGYDNYMPVVFFEFNKFNIQDRYHEGLAALARLMVANPSAKVSLYGNCDAVGTEVKNKELGQKRADAVKKYLTDVYGVDASRLETVSKGKDEPFSNVKNKKDQDPLNRRVDYKILK